ncbi:MAG: hypothetical protein CSB19_00085 [Clostridiales bacterium]|nr:MAG: hypothetical protein CSB19_00085 [Clostridiales bacterium]
MVDLGIYKPTTPPTEKTYKLGDYVWYDTNKNGIQDAGEIGVKDVIATLYKKDISGNYVATGATTTTNSNGYYEFAGLLNGEYQVKFSNLPVGYVISPTDQGGNDAVDSDGLNPTGEIKDADNMTLDLGIYKPTTPPTPKKYKIGDTVWDDKDNDGIQDSGEPGVAGVKVTLKDGNGIVIATTTTDSNGNYSFTGLDNGDYIVEFDPTTFPAGYGETKHNQGGNDAVDSDGLSVNVTINNADDLTIDLGIYKQTPLPPTEKKYKIGDIVWDDKDNDGIQDPGEPGVAGVKVTLKDGNGIVIATTTTDSNGNYIFEGLDDGDYIVEFDPNTFPAGYGETKHNQGGNDAVDSDGLQDW